MARLQKRTVVVPRFRPPPPREAYGYSRSMYYYRPWDLVASLALDYYIEHYGRLSREIIEYVNTYSRIAGLLVGRGRGGEPRALAAALLYYTLSLTGANIDWRSHYRLLGVPKQTAYIALRRLVREAVGHGMLFYRLLLHGLERLDTSWTTGGRLVVRGLNGRIGVVTARCPLVEWEAVLHRKVVYVPAPARSCSIDAYTYRVSA